MHFISINEKKDLATKKVLSHQCSNFQREFSLQRWVIYRIDYDFKCVFFP